MHIFVMTVLGALLGYAMKVSGLTMGNAEYWMILIISMTFYVLGMIEGQKK